MIADWYSYGLHGICASFFLLCLHSYLPLLLLVIGWFNYFVPDFKNLDLLEMDFWA
jgi:hypothetical protein